MSCRFSSGAVLKRVFEGVRELIRVVTLEVDTEGWSMKAYDESRISAFKMQLNLAAFEKYECLKPMKLGISVPSMNKILRLCDPADALILCYTENCDFIIIRIEKDASARVVEFELKLMDYEDEDIPELEQLSEDFVELPVSEYSRVTKDLQYFGDDFEIQATKNMISFRTAGEQGQGNISIKAEGGASIFLNKSYTQVFPLRYACAFSRAANCSTFTTLHFSDAPKPIVIRFAIDTKPIKDEVKEDLENNAKTRLLAPCGGYFQFQLCAKSD